MKKTLISANGYSAHGLVDVEHYCASGEKSLKNLSTKGHSLVYDLLGDGGVAVQILSSDEEFDEVDPKFYKVKKRKGLLDVPSGKIIFMDETGLEESVKDIKAFEKISDDQKLIIEPGKYEVEFRALYETDEGYEENRKKSGKMPDWIEGLFWVLFKLPLGLLFVALPLTIIMAILEFGANYVKGNGVVGFWFIAMCLSIVTWIVGYFKIFRQSKLDELNQKEREELEPDAYIRLKLATSDTSLTEGIYFAVDDD